MFNAELATSYVLVMHIDDDDVEERRRALQVTVGNDDRLTIVSRWPIIFNSNSNSKSSFFDAYSKSLAPSGNGLHTRSFLPL
jgi:hypothetical protein